MKLIQKRLKASFTIETSYVLAITLLCISTVIVWAYKQRDRVVEGYVVHEAQEEATHLETTWDMYGMDEDGVEEKAGRELMAIGKLSGTQVGIDSSWSKIVAQLDGADNDIQISSYVYDPEGFMRRSTVIEELIDKYKKHSEETTEEEEP